MPAVYRLDEPSGLYKNSTGLQGNASRHLGIGLSENYLDIRALRMIRPWEHLQYYCSIVAI